jgi:hypothetical protein
LKMNKMMQEYCFLPLTDSFQCILDKYYKISLYRRIRSYDYCTDRCFNTWEKVALSYDTTLFGALVTGLDTSHLDTKHASPLSGGEKGLEVSATLPLWSVREIGNEIQSLHAPSSRKTRCNVLSLWLFTARQHSHLLRTKINRPARAKTYIL